METYTIFSNIHSSHYFKYNITTPQAKVSPLYALDFVVRLPPKIIFTKKCVKASVLSGINRRHSFLGRTSYSERNGF